MGRNFTAKFERDAWIIRFKSTPSIVSTSHSFPVLTIENTMADEAEFANQVADLLEAHKTQFGVK